MMLDMRRLRRQRLGRRFQPGGGVSIRMLSTGAVGRHGFSSDSGGVHTGGAQACAVHFSSSHS